MKWTDADSHDLVGYCDYLAEGHLDVNPKTAPFLLDRCQQVPNRKPIDLLVEALNQRLKKRKTSSQVFALLYTLSTLLPEELFSPEEIIALWNCSSWNSRRMPHFIRNFLQALLNNELPFKSLAALLTSMGKRKNLTSPSEHGGKQIERVQLGHCTVPCLTPPEEQVKYLARALLCLTPSVSAMIYTFMKGPNVSSYIRGVAINALLELLASFHPAPRLCSKNNLIEAWRKEPLDWIALLLSEPRVDLHQAGWLAWKTRTASVDARIAEREGFQLLQRLAPLNLENALKVAQELKERQWGEPEEWQKHLYTLFRATAMLNGLGHRHLPLVTQLYSWQCSLQNTPECTEIPLDVIEELVGKKRVGDAIQLTLSVASVPGVPEWLKQVDALQRDPTPAQIMRTLPSSSLTYAWTRTLLAEKPSTRAAFEETCADMLISCPSDEEAAALLLTWQQENLFDSSYTPARLWLKRCAHLLGTGEGLPQALFCWEIGFRNGFLQYLPYAQVSPFLTAFLLALLPSSDKEKVHLAKEILARMRLESDLPVTEIVAKAEEKTRNKRKFNRQVQRPAGEHTAESMEQLLRLVDRSDPHQMQQRRTVALKNHRELLELYRKSDPKNIPLDAELLHLILTALRKAKLGNAEIKSILQTLQNLSQDKSLLDTLLVGWEAWIDQKRFEEAELHYALLLKGCLCAEEPEPLLRILRKAAPHLECETVVRDCLEMLLSKEPDAQTEHKLLQWLQASPSAASPWHRLLLKAVRKNGSPALWERTYEAGSKIPPPPELEKERERCNQWISYETELHKLLFKIYACKPESQRLEQVLKTLKELREVQGVRLAHGLKNLAQLLALLPYAAERAPLYKELEKGRKDLERYLSHPQVQKLRFKVDFQLARAFCTATTPVALVQDSCLLLKGMLGSATFEALYPKEEAAPVFKLCLNRLLDAPEDGNLELMHLLLSHKAIGNYFSPAEYNAYYHLLRFRRLNNQFTVRPEVEIFAQRLWNVLESISHHPFSNQNGRKDLATHEPGVSQTGP